MKISFITRRYPPTLGGIQTFSYHLYKNLRLFEKTDLYAYKMESNICLPFFYIHLFIKICLKIIFKKTDIIYFSDGVGAIMIPLFRIFFKTPCYLTIHGLEITYNNKIFHFFLKRALLKCNGIISVSKNTTNILIKNNIPEKKIRTIYSGVEIPKINNNEILDQKKRFEKKYKISLSNTKAVLSIARLVKRKGISEFIEKGFPLLDNDCIYIIAGYGFEKENIIKAINKSPFSERIFFIGKISKSTANMLRYFCGVFIMPNIKVKNDVEGFGLSVIEAYSLGLPVVSFNVDALNEAIGEMGCLIKENDYYSFANTVNSIISKKKDSTETKKQRLIEYVKNKYSWKKTSENYICFFKKSLKD